MILIKLFLLSWFFTHFEPGQLLLDKLYKYIPTKLKPTRTYLGCFKCVSFWLTLIITLNIFYAIGLSLIAYTYSRIMNSLRIMI